MGTKSNIRKVLICGLGSIGRKHLNILKSRWDNIEVAVFRSGYGNKSKEEILADKIYKELDKAIGWMPEAAIIATPASNHQNMAMSIGRCGIPMLIEKPLGDGKEGQNSWDELVELSEKVPIEIGYVFRHDPCTKKVKELLGAKIIGNIVEADFYCGSWLPDWREGIDYRKCVSSKRELGGGVLLELSHEIDLALNLFGRMKIEYASLKNSGLLEINVEDQARVIAKTEEGCTVTISLNFCTMPARRNVVIRGSGGEIYWNLIDSTIDVVRGKNLEPIHYRSISKNTERYVKQMEHFLSVSEGIAQPRCNLKKGIEVMEIIEKIREIDRSYGK